MQNNTGKCDVLQFLTKGESAEYRSKMFIEMRKYKVLLVKNVAVFCVMTCLNYFLFIILTPPKIANLKYRVCIFMNNFPILCDNHIFCSHLV